MTKPRVGRLPPRYSFILNPHSDYRASKCPICERPTFLRKFPLLIGSTDWGVMVLGKTCQYCARCELLICHQDELEAELANAFERLDPEAIGSEYMVLGTLEKKAWRKGLEDRPQQLGEMLEHVADFKKVLDLEYDPGGWRRE